MRTDKGEKKERMRYYMREDRKITAGGKIVHCDGQGEVMKQRNSRRRGLEG